MNAEALNLRSLFNGVMSYRDSHACVKILDKVYISFGRANAQLTTNVKMYGASLKRMKNRKQGRAGKGDENRDICGSSITVRRLFVGTKLSKKKMRWAGDLSSNGSSWYKLSWVCRGGGRSASCGEGSRLGCPAVLCQYSWSTMRGGKGEESPVRSWGPGGRAASYIKSARRRWSLRIDSSTAPSVTAVDRVSMTEVRCT